MCCFSMFRSDCVVFFFKQKTAYEMRISDWSSDVCSSDLTAAISAWRAAADEIPGVREVLDHYAAHPVDDEMAHAMRTAVAKQRQTLAVVAGRVSSMDADEHGARIGAEIEAVARAGHVLPEPPASRDNVRPLDRPRAAMAAA